MSESITGLSIDRMSINAMNSPYRKKKGLFIYDAHTNVYRKVATFQNDEAAIEFMEYLYKFVRKGRWSEGFHAQDEQG